MQPLLFYSEACPYSRKILERLRMTPNADRMLRLACVDNQIDRIPAAIDRVPALLVPTANGNRVVFDAEMYDWLNSILRIDDAQQTPRQGRRDAAPAPPRAPAAPQEFVSETDAFLCDLGGGADSASHLFAHPGEEIRITDGAPRGAEPRDEGRRDGRDGRDGGDPDDVINKLIAARNHEISALYTNVPRPV